VLGAVERHRAGNECQTEVPPPDWPLRHSSARPERSPRLPLPLCRPGTLSVITVGLLGIGQCGEVIGESLLYLNERIFKARVSGGLRDGRLKLRELEESVQPQNWMARQDERIRNSNLASHPEEFGKRIPRQRGPNRAGVKAAFA